MSPVSRKEGGLRADVGKKKVQMVNEAGNFHPAPLIVGAKRKSFHTIEPYRLFDVTMMLWHAGAKAGHFS